MTTTDHKTRIIYVTPSDLTALYGDEAAADMPPYRQAVCDSCGWTGTTRHLNPDDTESVEHALTTVGDDARAHRERPEDGKLPTVKLSNVPTLTLPEDVAGVAS